MFGNKLSNQKFYSLYNYLVIIFFIKVQFYLINYTILIWKLPSLFIYKKSKQKLSILAVVSTMFSLFSLKFNNNNKRNEKEKLSRNSINIKYLISSHPISCRFNSILDCCVIIIIYDQVINNQSERTRETRPLKNFIFLMLMIQI